VLPHERLERLDVNAMPDVKEGAVLDALLVAVTHHFPVDVEVEVKMIGGELHAPDTALSVERGTTALASESGSRKLKAPSGARGVNGGRVTMPSIGNCGVSCFPC
jgi:hypothetical protein